MSKLSIPLVLGLLFGLAIGAPKDCTISYAQADKFPQHPPTTIKECTDMSRQVVDDIVEHIMDTQNVALFFKQNPVEKILQQMCQQQRFDQAYKFGSQMEATFGAGAKPIPTPTPRCEGFGRCD
jgi:hypothetical protein